MSTEITVTIPEEKLRKGIESAIDSILKSDYSNPVRAMVENAIKDQQGPLKLFVDQLIAEAVTDPAFKEKMSQVVITKLVEAALKK